MAARNALDRHLALVGFMGAGKSTLGPQLAARLGRDFVELDAVVEKRAGTTIAELFATDGEARFRQLEEEAALDVLAARTPAVIELGGGALGSERTRSELRDGAFTIHLGITADEAWARVSGTTRPLARDPEAFRALHADRQALYADADAMATDLDGALLAAAGVRFGDGFEVGGDAVVADAGLAAIHESLDGARVVSAKSLAEAERLWSTLALERSSMLVAVGGGTTTDLVGFVAATYMRGIDWIAVPSTLVGQVDAAIGGKTGIDLAGKNLVGAFHWPSETVLDVSLLDTLPEVELRNGMAEVVKTGLLAGESLWELDRRELVRRCAAYKAAVCLRDPRERGDRAQLNLGHTFAHALETASGYTVSHGHAVALGLLAALRLSGLEDEAQTVDAVLAPARVVVDRDVAWEVLQRDKKVRDGRVNLVLLDAPGAPRITDELEPERVRAALDALIA